MRLTFHTVERLYNSVNGNPRYRIFTNEGTFVTQSDAGWVYLTPKAGSDYEVELTNAGRIANATEVTTDEGPDDLDESAAYWSDRDAGVYDD